MRDYERVAVYAFFGRMRFRSFVLIVFMATLAVDLRPLAAQNLADPARPHLFPGTATPFYGYGYQTWIFPRADRSFALLGVYGQSIYVDPESKLVMVHLAARARPSNNPEGAQAIALWRGVRASLGR